MSICLSESVRAMYRKYLFNTGKYRWDSVVDKTDRELIASYKRETKQGQQTTRDYLASIYPDIKDSLDDMSQEAIDDLDPNK